MSSSSDLARAMKSSLEESGDLIRLKAQLEEEMLEALQQMQSTSSKGGSESSFPTRRCKPAMPPEIILANNLVRQYLEYVGLTRTSAVLSTESGLPDKPVSDAVLKAAFPTVENPGKRPLLFHMVNKVFKPVDQ